MSLEIHRRGRNMNFAYLYKISSCVCVCVCVCVIIVRKRVLENDAAYVSYYLFHACVLYRPRRLILSLHNDDNTHNNNSNILVYYYMIFESIRFRGANKVAQRTRLKKGFAGSWHRGRR
jgi:hypothetical protein